MAATSIKLLAGTVTLLLLPAGQNMDIHWPRWKILDHNRLVRAIMFVGPIDAACVPVSPVDKLAIHGHGKGVDGCADNDLPIGTTERAAFNLLSNDSVKCK